MACRFSDRRIASNFNANLGQEIIAVIIELLAMEGFFSRNPYATGAANICQDLLNN